MGKKIERGKAAAAPVQRHNLKNYFDITNAAAHGPPQAQMLQQPVNNNANNVQDQPQHHQQAADTNIVAHGGGDPLPSANINGSAGPSRVQPVVNKHLVKVAEIDLLDNNVSSQIEWQDTREDNIRALWKSPSNGGDGNGDGFLNREHNADQHQPAERTAVNKQRLLQGQAEQARPLAPSGSGSPGDDLLEEVLAGLGGDNNTSAHGGGNAAGLNNNNGGHRRRVSNGSPASEITNRSGGGIGTGTGAGPFRTPATVQRRPGIIRNNNNKSLNGNGHTRLNRLGNTGRGTPTSVAFKTGPNGGGGGGGLGPGVKKPRFGGLPGAGNGNGGTTTGKKRRAAQFCVILEDMLDCLGNNNDNEDDDLVMDGDGANRVGNGVGNNLNVGNGGGNNREVVNAVGCNDIVGPSSRIAAVGVTASTTVAAIVGSPQAAAPPSQRPRHDDSPNRQQQQQQEHGLAPGVMHQMNKMFENWQSPTKQHLRQQQEQQQQANAGVATAAAAAEAAAPPTSPLAEVVLAPTQPQPAAMEAPPPSPYIHQANAPPSQSRNAAQVALEAIQRNAVVVNATSKINDAAAAAAAKASAAAIWGEDSDEDDVEEMALIEAAEAAAVANRNAHIVQNNTTTAAAAAAPQQVGTKVLASATQPSTTTQPENPSSSPSSTLPKLAGDRALVHFKIVAVWPECPTVDGTSEIQLQLHNPYSGLQVIAHVQSPYDQDVVYLPNDPVNIMVPQYDEFNGQYHCIVGGARGHPRAMLVHYPDVLLGGTRVAGSTHCPRQGFLQERIAGGDGTNIYCTQGNIYHSLFQTALAKGLRQSNQLEKVAQEIAASCPVDLLDSNMSEHQAYEYLKKGIPRLIGMLNKFQRETPLPTAVLSAGHVDGSEVKRVVSIPEVLDIEEYIASPKFGLKGFVDASIKLKILPVGQSNINLSKGNNNNSWMKPKNEFPSGSGGEIVVAPLELKTGNPRDSDVAQVLLYLLAMEERYGHPLHWGLLVNHKNDTRNTEPHRLIARQDTHLATLMAARNRLAAALARGSLPALVETKSSCNKCYARRECMLTHAAIEHPPDAVGALPGAAVGAPDAGNTSFVGGMLGGSDRDTLEAAYQSETAHLTPNDREFLRHWASLLDLEASGATKQRPEIWAMTGHAREAAGRCVTGLTIIRAVKKEAPSTGVLYTFARRVGGGISSPFPLGEMLMLGVDGRHAGVGRGHLFECTPETLTVYMEKELREGLLFPQGRFAVAGNGGGGGSQAGVVCCDPSVSWRIDKEEVGTTTPRMRGFLYSLFARSFDNNGKEDLVSTRAARLRRLIVDLEFPGATDASNVKSEADQRLIQVVAKEARLLNLNAEQHHAVRCAVLCKHYSLVLGMPGAGKTTAIVAMLRSLATAGKRVLLTSYTNSAVDNVLLKLAEMAVKEEFIPFVRVGRESRVAPALLDYTPSGAQHNANTAGELASLVDTVKIWGVSALGATDALIRRREFDVVIVDEAGQITLPATLGPLLRGNTFVLVGDPHQLPPLVTNEEAAEKGLAEPLFARLAAAHPSAVVTLPVQYRMADEIQVLPNLLSYNGEMRCGRDSVANQMLHFPRWASLVGIAGPASSASPASWIAQVLDPLRRVVFLDTSSMPAPEVKIGEAVTNPSEADITLALVTAAVRAGLPATSIGLISPYNRQVSLLSKLTQSAGVGVTECLTIDKAQGRDKECVIVSLVKSNVEKETGKLLSDLRRVNVAITRAKAKLIIIGDATTLRVLPLFEKVLRKCEERQWILTVPPGALEKYKIPIIKN